MEAKRYYHMIEADYVVYDMIRYSMISCKFASDPSLDEIIAYKESLRCIKDVSEPALPKCYILIPMRFDFSTPFEGYHAHTLEETKEILKQPGWEHNQ